MRIALKSTLALVSAYLLILAGLALWVEHEIRSIANSLMEDTARLVGGELAAVITGPALDQLLLGDPSTRLRLAQTVGDFSQRSNLVASIAVVDDKGQVVVSDELEAGHQLALPGVLFQDSPRTQLVSTSSPLEYPKYHLLVPLQRDGAIVGYIRLALSSHQIATLYGRERRQLVLAAVAGLSCIGVLGLLLHLQLTHRGRVLAAALEARVRGEPAPESADLDEFATALEAAGRLGRELTQTRERHTQMQRRMNALASFMDVGVVLLDSEQKVEFANPAAEQLLGCDDPTQVDARWQELRPQVSTHLDRAEGAAPRVDVDLSSGDRTRHLRLELHHPPEDRESTLVLLKDRDQLDAFETDLRLAMQMRGLARIYSALAHELRAPLGAMALNLELLRDELHKLDPADIGERPAKYADVLHHELDRLNRSLLTVLNQTTSVQEKRERFDIGGIIRDLEALLRPQAKRQKVELDVEVPATELLLTGHRDRLKQAFLNLATNALEAMPEGGKLQMKVAPANNHATVAIADTGPGIPPEIADQIYGMYFTTKHGGTGVGLYVTRSIIESHCGEIRFDSETGAGTCFQIQLPLDPKEV